MTGLNIAENGRSIGSGLGLLLGVPGMGLLGNYLGDQYIGNNVFQSPFTSPVQQDINNFVGGPGSPAFDNAQARMNSSSGGEYAGPGAGRMNQRGNRHAGMPSDFRTQFNWAHGGSGGGGGGANALVPFYLT